jgi:hypothetical protein
VFLHLEGMDFQELQCATEKEAFELGESFCNALHAANVLFGHDERPDFVVMSGSLTDAGRAHAQRCPSMSSGCGWESKWKSLRSERSAREVSPRHDERRSMGTAL